MQNLCRVGVHLLELCMSANRLDAKSRRKGVTKCQKREKSKIMISSIGNVNFFSC